jgi:hypothetical protein
MRCPANKTFQIQEKFTFSTLHSSYIRRVARRLVRTLGLHCIALHCIALHCIALHCKANVTFRMGLESRSHSCRLNIVQ